MAGTGGWVFLKDESVPADAQPVNFPAIDKVRGEGGAARMIEGRQALGGEYGFKDEVLPWSDEVGAGASAAVTCSSPPTSETAPRPTPPCGSASRASTRR